MDRDTSTSPAGRLLAAAACVCACLAIGGWLTAPAGAAGVGAGKSFSELTSGGAETATTSSTPAVTSAKTAAETAPSNSRTLILVAIGAAVLLISGIGFVIIRDARRVAPVGDGDMLQARPARDSAAQMRRRRARAKAARRQRKRNR